MSTLKISPFGGLMPRTSDRLIPDGMANTAENVNLTSGDIRPLRSPLLDYNTGVLGSVFRAEANNVEKWRTWSGDVDVARAPLASDVEQRYYWTGDGEPRFSLFTNFQTPATDLALGIPNPTTAVSVSHSGGIGTATTRFYRYTFVSQYGEESGPSPVSVEATGKIDDAWSITGMQDFPVNSGTGTATGQVFTDTVPHWLRVGDQVVISSVTHTVTAISGLTFTVDGVAITGATAWERVADWNTTGMYRRLYRTSGTGGQYQLVADNITATTYSDTLLDSAIEGDDLITEGWEPPRTDLKGLGVLPSGAMYGFSGSLLCFSEPYQPHSWPRSYELGLDYEIVGTASFGTTVVAATKGQPYYADGVEPASATAQKVDQNWTCLSKKGVTSVGDGVVFPTTYGVAYIGMAGPRLFTENYYTKLEWELLNPETMHAAFAMGRLHVSYQTDDGLYKMLIFDTDGSLTTATLHSLLLYSDQRDGLLYVSGPLGIYKYAESTGLGQNWAWKSKTWILPPPINLGACRIDFDGGASAADTAAAVAQAAAIVAENVTFIAGYDRQGGFGGSAFGRTAAIGGSGTASLPATSAENLTFTLFINDQVKFSNPVYTDRKTFRLPAGYKGDTVAVQLTGNVSRVRSIKLAETMDGLRQI